MVSREARDIYRTCRKKILQYVGNRGPMDDDEISRVCTELFGNRWVGVCDAGHFKPQQGYFIVNTSYKSTSVGSHWVAIIVEGTFIYVYDSYGRTSSLILQKLEKKLTNTKYDLIDITHAPFQRRSQVCGQLSISWLYMAHTCGLAVATII